MKNIQVRPTDHLHGSLKLTNRVTIYPSDKEWRELPFTPDTIPDDVKRMLDFHYNKGQIEVSTYSPKVKRVTKDDFYCSDPNGNHHNEKVPAVSDGLCAFCHNQAFPEVFGN
jgi:hypothetical protein